MGFGGVIEKKREKISAYFALNELTSVLNEPTECAEQAYQVRCNRLLSRLKNLSSRAYALFASIANNSSDLMS